MSDEKDRPSNARNPDAVALGSLGGKKGGPARARKLSHAVMRHIAKIAARARWRKEDEKGGR